MSRKIRYFGPDIIVAEGEDKLVGNFITVYDRNYTEDPGGEGIIFSWDEFGGVAYSKVFFDVKAFKNSSVPWNQPDPPLTPEEAWQFVKETYLKDVEERFPPKNTESTHNGENPNAGSKEDLPGKG